jgi:hypothetical protein
MIFGKLFVLRATPDTQGPMQEKDAVKGFAI